MRSPSRGTHRAAFVRIMLTLSARAIGYIRVSTEQQADSGLGLEAQQTSISGAALRLGLELSRRC